MKAAVIYTFGEPPRYEDFDDPTPRDGESLLSVRAAGLHPLVKGLARGTHYASRPNLPMIPGVDGVGRTNDGRRFYFGWVAAPYGTMAERAAANFLLPIPDDVSDTRCAALVNPGISGWLALVIRAKLVAGESVLVLGATGAAGSLAVQVAKHLGARRVVAAGRDKKTLSSLLKLGADATVNLDGTREELSARIVDAMGPEGADVVLDYVWGAPAEAAIDAVTRKRGGSDMPRVRYVQVGNSAGPTIALAGATLRSSGLELMGSGIGSVPMSAFAAEIPRFLGALGAKAELAVDEVQLKDVARVWDAAQERGRVVFVP